MPAAMKNAPNIQRERSLAKDGTGLFHRSIQKIYSSIYRMAGEKETINVAPFWNPIDPSRFSYTGISSLHA